MRTVITDLCCDPFCSNEATQAATPPGVDGLRVLLCDKHAGRFVRLAKERNIPLEELGLEALKVSAPEKSAVQP